MAIVTCPSCGSGLLLHADQRPAEHFQPISPYLPVIREVCEAHGYTLAQIQAPDRSLEAVRARRAAMRAAQEAGASVRQIARLLKRDHSTVVSALQREAA